MIDEQLLTPKQAASYLNISTSTLAKNRMKKDRIPFIKIGRSVRYELSVLNSYIESNRRT